MHDHIGGTVLDVTLLRPLPEDELAGWDNPISENHHGPQAYHLGSVESPCRPLNHQLSAGAANHSEYQINIQGSDFFWRVLSSR